jgi:hypothetical protein
MRPRGYEPLKAAWGSLTRPRLHGHLISRWGQAQSRDRKITDDPNQMRDAAITPVTAKLSVTERPSS